MSESTCYQIHYLNDCGMSVYDDDFAYWIFYQERSKSFEMRDIIKDIARTVGTVYKNRDRAWNEMMRIATLVKEQLDKRYPYRSEHVITTDMDPEMIYYQTRVELPCVYISDGRFIVTMELRESRFDEEAVTIRNENND